MKFPRHSRLLRGPFDMAPFAAVLFLLVIFLMLGGLIYTPGVAVSPPLAEGLPGTDQPTVSVAMDAGGRLYFENQIIARDKLKSALKAAVHKSRQPLTLVIHADKSVTFDQLVDLVMLAKEPEIGITNFLWATRPANVATPVEP